MFDCKIDWKLLAFSLSTEKCESEGQILEGQPVSMETRAFF